MAKKARAYDPVEAAKVDYPGQAPREEAAESPPVEVASPIAKASKDDEPTVKVNVPDAPMRKRYRIERSDRTSPNGRQLVTLEGSLTHVNAGDVISEGAYSPESIAKMRSQGVVLTEL